MPACPIANTEVIMSALKRLWSRTAQFMDALEDMGDPVGDYMVSLGKRVDGLERKLAHLEEQLHAEPQKAESSH